MIRRRIALMLAIVLMVSILPNSSIYAIASGQNDGLDPQTPGSLRYINNYGLEYRDFIELQTEALGEDEALLSIGMSADATYELRYFVQTHTESLYEVAVDFYKGQRVIDEELGIDREDLSSNMERDPGNIAVAIEVRNTKDGEPLLLDYDKRKYPYQSGEIEDRETEQYVTNLRIDSAREYRELGIEFGKGFEKVHIKMMYDIETGNMLVQTDNIRKSIITEFKLNENSVKVYKGIDLFEVSPTHLEVIEGDGENQLSSKDIIYEGDSDIPGSRPGVKIEFEIPKYIDEDWNMTYLGDEDNVNAIINVVEVLGQGSQYQLTVPLFDGGIIKNDDGEPVGELKIKTIDDKEIAEIYISRDKEYLEEEGNRVIEWDILDSSMLLLVGIEYVGGVFDEIKEEENEFVYENGYTYAEYEPRRVSEEEVIFEVKPYNLTGSIPYKLEMSNSGTTNWRELYTRLYDSSDGLDRVPLVSRDKSSSYYRVEIGNYGWQTQIIQYDPNKEEMPLEPTRIQEIKNIYVVPHTDGNQPQAIGLDLVWEALPDSQLRSLLEKGDIYYELYLHDENGEELQEEAIKVFRVYLDEEDETDPIKLESYAGTAGNTRDEENVPRYNASNSTFEMPNVVLKNNNALHWEQLEFPENYEREPSYPGADEITRSDELEGALVPGKYYLSLNRVYDAEDSNKILFSSRSPLESLVLDEVVEIIEVPSNITHVELGKDEDGEELGIQIDFDKIDLRNYVDKMLTPIDLELQDRYERIYEIYLYQDSGMTDKRLEEIRQENIAQKLEEGETVEIDAEYLREKDNAILLEYTDIENSGRATFQMTGLDKNKAYYIKVRTRIEPIPVEETRTDNEVDERHSVFSRVYTFTTESVPVPPNPDDMVPPTPEDIILEIINNSTARISWIESDDIRYPEETYYEIVRVEGERMDEDGTGRSDDIESILENYPTYIAFRSSPDGMENIEKNDGSGWEPIDFLSMHNMFEDDSLSPNTLYYYYIRTVVEVEGKEVRSDWIHNPITTEPVQKPIGVEIKEEWYRYDPKTQAVISFFAPIPDGASIPEDYDFEIAVRGEEDEDYRLDYTVNRLEVSDEDDYVVPTGYQYYVYHIDGLDPNRRYDIKVRVVDKTKEIGEDEEYPKSLYSDSIMYRTEYDEEREEEDNKFDDYLKKYDQEAEKLKYNPYWTLESSSREGVYKYRSSYVNSEFSLGNIYQLVSKEGANTLRYYLPSNMIEEAIRQGITLQAIVEEIDVQVRPGTITESTDEIKAAIQDKEDRKIEDYMIEFEITLLGGIKDIYGQDTLTSEIIVNLSVVHMKSKEYEIEDEILSDLEEYIARYRLEVIDDLEREIYDRGNISDEALDRIIDSAIGKVKDKHERQVQRTMERAIDKTYEVGEIQKPLLIEATMTASNVGAYYRSGRIWESVQVFWSSNGYMIEGAQLGSYIFTGSHTSVEIPSDLPGSSNFIAKYGLSDFLRVDHSGMESYVTRYQVYASVARVMGSGKVIDPTTYLTQRGVNGLSLGNQSVQIRQDEAIYIVMQGYEKIHYRDVNTIYVSDRQVVQNIGAFQPQYIPYVYAAVEIGAITPTNGMVIPSQQVTTKQLIYMLMKIDPS